MRLKLVSPAELADLARATIGQVVETAAAAVTIPMRAVAVLGQTELLVSRMTVLANEAESLIRRVGTVVAEAEETVAEARAITTAATVVVTEAQGITGAAAEVVAQASTLSGAAEGVIVTARSIAADATDVVRRADSTAANADELLDGYTDTLRKGAPLAARFVNELSPDEVTAAIRMVDQLPRLREHLVDDVMPLLAKLDQVGPDLHKLLEVTEDLRLAIAGIPGLRMLKRRGEERSENG
jgi:hypothetical protein